MIIIIKYYICILNYNCKSKTLSVYIKIKLIKKKYK